MFRIPSLMMIPISSSSYLAVCYDSFISRILIIKHARRFRRSFYRSTGQGCWWLRSRHAVEAQSFCILGKVSCFGGENRVCAVGLGGLTLSVACVCLIA